jgi:hypothetical protein
VNAAAVATATKDLGVRFRLVSLLPTVVLGLFALALAWSGAPGSPPDVSRVVEHAQDVTGWAGFLLILTLLVAALIVEPFQLALVRALEGYWGESRVGRLLAAPGKAFHRARRARLSRAQQRRGSERRVGAAAREEAARKLRAYPPAEALLPTKLGNLLRAAEHRAGSRYGLDAVTVWPRLYPLLSDKVTAGLNDFRDQLDLAVRFCSVFLAATVISVACLATHGWWLAVAAGALLLAVLSYRGALAAAAGYGQAVEAAVDLHRFDLIRAFHLPLPTSLTVEVRTNEQLSQFLRQPHEYLYALTTAGDGTDFAYDHGAWSAGAAAPARMSRTSLWTRLRAGLRGQRSALG